MAEIASAFVSLIPSFRGGGTAIAKELGGAGKAAGGSAGKVTGGAMSAGILGSLKGLAGPMSAIFAGAGIASFVKDSIGAASDLNETVNKSGVIFGGASKQMQSWAKDSATALGLSREQALDSAASFGDMFSQLGLGSKAAAATSQKVVQLAADLGSFNNLGTEDVAERISAGFRGEYDSLQTLIPNINAARVEQEALRRTGKKSAKDLTALEKAQATLAIVQHDGARAQGDFARTAGGAANQQKILAAQTQDLKAKMGTALLPAVTSVQGALIKAAPALGTLADGFAKLATSGIGKVSSILKSAKPYLDAFINGLSGGSAGGSGPFATLTNLGNTIRGFAATVLPVLKQIGSQVMAVLGPALKQIGSIISTQVVPAFQAFLPVVAPIAAFLLRLFGSAIVGALKGVVNVVKGVLTVLAGIFNIFAGIFTGNWSKVWQGIKQVASGIWSAIKGAFQIFINVGLGRVFKLGGALLAKIGRGIWSALGRLFSAGTRAVGSIVSRGVVGITRFFAALPGKAVGVLASLAGKLGKLFTGALNRARTAVTSGVGKVLGKLKEIPGKAASALGNLGKTLYRAGASLIGGLINGITDKIGQLKSKLSEVTGLIPDWKGPASRDANLLRPNGRLILGGLISGIDDQVPSLASTLGGITGRVPGMLDSPALAGPGAAGAPEVRVFIGERELTDIVRVEVGETNRTTRRRVLAGVGSSW